MLKNYTCRGVTDKHSRKKLKVWERYYQLCLEIYKNTKMKIETGKLEILQEGIGEVDRMLKALDPLNP